MRLIIHLLNINKEVCDDECNCTSTSNECKWIYPRQEDLCQTRNDVAQAANVETNQQKLSKRELSVFTTHYSRQFHS